MAKDPMDAREKTEELSRLAQLPQLDDAQLDTLVAALESSDSYTDQEDDGYGSTSSREYVTTVSGCAELALEKAGAKVFPRLVQRLRLARGRVLEALLRVLGTAPANAWAALAPPARVSARNLLELAVGSAPRALATLEVADEQVTALAARARDLIALRLLAIDAGEHDVERAVEPVVRALLGPSRASRKAALEAVVYLRGSPRLGPLLLDALLDPRTSERWDVSSAIRAVKLSFDGPQRARLANLVDDPALGFYARELLAPSLLDASAEAELPLAERVLPSIARAVATDPNEGAWRLWLERLGRDTFGRALVPVLRAHLLGGKVTDTALHHMAIVGPPLAPLAPELLPYLAPATSPSARHVRWAIAVAGAIKSPLTVPALVPLLATPHQYEALVALAALGPAAAAAVPAIEQLGSNRGGVNEDILREAQATALTKIRGDP